MIITTPNHEAFIKIFTTIKALKEYSISTSQFYYKKASTLYYLRHSKGIILIAKHELVPQSNDICRHDKTFQKLQILEIKKNSLYSK